MAGRPHSNRNPKPAIALLLSGVVIAACILLHPSAAVLAHARFDHSSPAPGQVLPASPASVDIYTVQDMQKTAGAYGITVVRDDNGSPGQQVDTGTPVMDDANRRHFSVGLQPNLAPGRYLVSFHNVSDEDGDADHGQFAFYIGAGPTSAQQALDAKLQITASVAATPAASKASTSASNSHTALYAIIVVIIVLLLVGGAFAWLRGTRRRP